MAERKAERKPLSFSTTMRNPDRIAGFLNCLAPFENQILTHECIMNVVRNVIREKLYKPVVIGRVPALKQIYESEEERFSDRQIEEIILKSPQNHKERGFDYGWDSRFDTFFKLPMEFGFVRYAMGKPVEISAAGHMLIDAMRRPEPDEEKLRTIFLNAMMKYQSNNPYRKNANANVPLVLLLQVLHLLKQDTEENGAGVYRQELSLFICWPDNNFRALYDKIKEIRRTVGYTYGDEYIYEICLKLLGASNRQRNRFKMSQICGEAVDEYIRKMRSTGVISLRGNGRFLDYNTWEIRKIEYILERYAHYESFESEETYFRYMGWVDPRMIAMTSAAPEDTRELKKQTLKKFAEEYSREMVFSELRKLGGKTPSTDYMLKLLPAPVRLEFLIGVALVQNLEELDVLPGYPVDDEGLPVNTAGGGRADIICWDGECRSLVEVTLMCGRQDQVSNEIVPIRRHLLEEKKTMPDTFSVFIAPVIHEDAREMAAWYKYRNNLDIIPYTVEEFIGRVQKIGKLKRLCLTVKEG